MDIIKRDGAPQAFDERKIVNAVYSAAKAADVAEQSACNLGVLIANEVAQHITGGEGVEEIQDAVENALIEEGEAHVARVYMNYRIRQAQLREMTADPTALSEYTFHSKYALAGEQWEDTVTRCEEMHLRRYPQAEKEIRWAFDRVREKKCLPSARSLQFGGRAIEVNHARLYNCSFTLLDRPRAFSEAFFLLLSGCGVGYSVQYEHVDKLPEFPGVNEEDVIHYRVGDTIEGWASALDALISGALSGHYVEFDYSDIRPAGSPLSTTHGVAPGHIPLKTMLEQVRPLLIGKLVPFEAHRIMCLIASAVLAGGIRRSSLIALFSHGDGEMATCKAVDGWMDVYPELALANNSVHVLLLGDNVPLEPYFDLMRQYGEPGIHFSGNRDWGTNPCGEIGLNPVYDGKTGFAFCNLTEINGLKYDREAVVAATIIGTLQAGYTDIPYVEEVTKKILVRDALLGVSITGINDAVITPHPDDVIDTNEQIAQLIGIKPASRLTCVKPSGNLSCLLGTSSGIHPHHAKRYFRRVTANGREPVFLEFKERNPHMCVRKPNGDWVITFPVQAPEGALTRNDIGAIDFMERVAQFKREWVDPGKRAPGPGHNVSATVTVRPEEWEAVVKWIKDHQVSMSFLPFVGDKVYPFAPFEEVSTVGDEANWRHLVEHYRPVFYSSGRDSIDNACEGPTCDL